MAVLMAHHASMTFAGLAPKEKINAGCAAGLKSQSLIYLSKKIKREKGEVVDLGKDNTPKNKVVESKEVG